MLFNKNILLIGSVITLGIVLYFLYNEYLKYSSKIQKIEHDINYLRQIIFTYNIDNLSHIDSEVEPPQINRNNSKITLNNSNSNVNSLPEDELNVNDEGDEPDNLELNQEVVSMNKVGVNIIESEDKSDSDLSDFPDIDTFDQESENDSETEDKESENEDSVEDFVENLDENDEDNVENFDVNKFLDSIQFDPEFDPNSNIKDDYEDKLSEDETKDEILEPDNTEATTESLDNLLIQDKNEEVENDKIDTDNFTVTEAKRCDFVIKSGKRKGEICNKLLTSDGCTYHKNKSK